MPVTSSRTTLTISWSADSPLSKDKIGESSSDRKSDQDLPFLSPSRFQVSFLQVCRCGAVPSGLHQARAFTVKTEVRVSVSS